MRSLHFPNRKAALIPVMLLGFLSLFSCSGTEHAENIITGYDAPPMENGEGLESIRYKIIPLEQTEDFALVSPKKIEIVDSTILVLDANRVIAYNSEGKYLRTIGERGNGHKEYLELSTFYIDDNKDIILLDPYKNTLLKFRKDGTFLDKKKLSSASLKHAQSVLPVSHDLLFVYNFLYNDSHQLCKTVNVSNEAEKEISATPLCTRNTMEYIGKSPCSAYQGRIRYVRPFDNHIYIANDSSVLRIDTQEHILSEEELREIKDYSIMTYANCLSNGTFTGFTDLYETGRYLMPACHNLFYTLIDKENKVCRRFNYTSKGDENGIPLYNIRGASGDRLIGLLSKEKLESLDPGNGNRIIQDLKKVAEEQPFDQALILYDIERLDL